MFTLVFLVAATPADKEDFSKYKAQDILQTKAPWLTVVRFAKPDEKDHKLFSNLLTLAVDARNKEKMEVIFIYHVERDKNFEGKVLMCAYKARYLGREKDESWHILDTDDVGVCNEALDVFIEYVEKEIQV